MQFMNDFKYWNPVEIHFGELIPSLSDIIEKKNQKILLVYGQQSMKKLGVIDRIKDLLFGCNILDIAGIAPNPTLKSIPCKPWFRGDWVIGIGGGSVLDCAKMLATNYRIPIIAIPTTSGTGSEVTSWATMWNFDKKVKTSFDTDYPRHAIIDPTLVTSLPAYETAYTGLDALSHALEAHWSVHSNPISSMCALSSIKLILSNLYSACMNPKQIEVRSAMSKASLYAGLAFSNTKTTAVHAVSYPMTLHYGIPHGVACSLLLPSFCDYNPGYEYFSDNVRDLSRDIKLPTTLRAAGIPKDGIDIIVDEGFHPDRVGNNPRPLTRSDLRKMLENIYE